MGKHAAHCRVSGTFYWVHLYYDYDWSPWLWPWLWPWPWPWPCLQQHIALESMQPTTKYKAVIVTATVTVCAQNKRDDAHQNKRDDAPLFHCFLLVASNLGPDLDFARADSWSDDHDVPVLWPENRDTVRCWQDNACYVRIPVCMYVCMHVCI